MTRPRYRLLDHTADMAFEVEAPDWEGLLAVATRALGDLILEARGADEVLEERAIEVAGEDREDVLVAWLSEAVVLFDEEAYVARDAHIEAADGRSARGVLRGRRLAPEKEEPDRVIKAVTYHDLHVVEGHEGAPWRATVVLDL